MSRYSSPWGLEDIFSGQRTDSLKISRSDSIRGFAFVFEERGGRTLEKKRDREKAKEEVEWGCSGFQDGRRGRGTPPPSSPLNRRIRPFRESSAPRSRSPRLLRFAECRPVRKIRGFRAATCAEKCSPREGLLSSVQCGIEYPSTLKDFYFLCQ